MKLISILFLITLYENLYANTNHNMFTQTEIDTLNHTSHVIRATNDNLSSYNLDQQNKLNGFNSYSSMEFGQIIYYFQWDQNASICHQALSWELPVDPSNQSATLDYYGYLSIGLGRADMFGTDMIVAIFKGDELISIDDYWSIGESKPKLDTNLNGTNDVYNISGTFNLTHWTFYWSRKSLTNDIYDYPLFYDNKLESCLAWRTDLGYKNHHENYRSYLINFEEKSKEIAKLITTNKQIWSNIHSWVLILFWGFLMDISIFIPRHLRMSKNYLNRHMIISALTVLLTLVLEMIMLILYYSTRKGYMTTHLIIGLGMMLLMIIQVMLGFISRKIMLDDKYSLYFSKIKYAHMMIGYTLYVLAKINIYVGTFINPDFKQNRWIGHVILAYYVVLITFRMYYENIRNLKNQKLYYNLKPKIPAYLTEKQKHLITMIHLGTHPSEINQILKGISWFVMDDYVFDVTGFDHPGGNYFLKACLGQDISRYFYGACSIGTFRGGHKHSDQAYKFLMSRCIGSLKVYSGFYVYTVDKIDDKSSAFPMISSPQSEFNQENQIEKRIWLTNRKYDSESEEEFEDTRNEETFSPRELLSFKEKGTLPCLKNKLKVGNTLETAIRPKFNWKLVNRTYLSHDIIKCEFMHDYKGIKTSINSIRDFGKHIKVSHENHPSTRLYTIVLSEMKENQDLKKEIIRACDAFLNNQSSPIDIKFNNKIEHSITFPFIFRVYPYKNAFSNYLSSIQIPSSGFDLSKVYGFGLQLPDILEGHYYIITGGTGILPFCDFIFFLLRKILADYLQKNEIIKQDANSRLIDQGLENIKICDSFHLSIYFCLKSIKDFINFDILNKLIEFNSFIHKNQGPKIDCFLRFSNKDDLNEFKSSFASTNFRLTTTKFDLRFAGSFINDPKRIYVCGSPEFDSSILDALARLNVPRSNIYNLQIFGKNKSLQNIEEMKDEFKKIGQIQKIPVFILCTFELFSV